MQSSYILKLILTLVFLMSGTISCYYGQNKTTASTVTPNEQNTSTSDTAVTSSNNQATPNSIQKREWQIPSLKKTKEKKTFVIKVKTSETDEINVNVSTHDMEYGQVIAFPYDDSVKIMVDAVRIFSFSKKSFCFKLNTQLASFDEERKEWIGSGPMFYSTYYDNDGDGKFETESSDDNEHFYAKPQIPKWILELRTASLK